MKVGDLIDVAAPRGTFFLTDSEAPVILLSAGVGATPVLSMLHALVKAGSTREVWWLHGARNGDEHPFAAESRALLDRLPNSRSRVYYSRPGSADRQGVDFTRRGGCRSVATRPAVRRGGLPVRPGFLHGRSECRTRDLRPGSAHIHTETFGATAALTPGIAATSVPPHLPPGPLGPGPEVQFARSAISAPWGPPYASLLEFAEACDVPTRWSCRTGVCHNCETALLAGAVRYDPEPLEPPAQGNILICCAQPTEAVVVDL